MVQEVRCAHLGCEGFLALRLMGEGLVLKSAMKLEFFALFHVTKSFSGLHCLGIE